MISKLTTKYTTPHLDPTRVMTNLIGSGRLGLTEEWVIEKLTQKCPQFQQRLTDGMVVEKVWLCVLTSLTVRLYRSHLVSCRRTVDSCHMSIVAMFFLGEVTKRSRIV